MTSNMLASIEKLTGSANYNDWKFSMRAYLMHEDMWKFIEGSEQDSNNLADLNLIKARSKLQMAVDKTISSYIREASTPKEIWTNLEKAFKDSGLTNKVSLLRTLIKTKLLECKNIDDYVNKIFTTAHKLNSLKFTITDEWIGLLLFAGLPDQFEPMIMALENSGISIKGDDIKVKLLQEFSSDSYSKMNQESALYTKRFDKQNSNYNKKQVRCFNCNIIGHIAAKCRKPKKRDSNNYNKEDSNAHFVNRDDDDNDDAILFMAADAKSITNVDDWFIDSGASEHMSPNKNYFLDFKEISHRSVRIANDQNLQYLGQGKIEVISRIDNREVKITLQNCLYVPDLKVNLISVSKLTVLGFDVKFDNQKCTVSKPDGKLLAIGAKEKQLYKLQWSQPNSDIALKTTLDRTPSHIWHQRLAHLNRKSMLELNDMVTGYSVLRCSSQPYETCVERKNVKITIRT